MGKLVDPPDLGSGTVMCESSSLSSRTKNTIDSEKLSIFLFTSSFFLIFDI